jgi:hypothetical protein
MAKLHGPGIYRVQFPFGRLQRKAFKSGTLMKEWKREYSFLFDKDDVRLALTQPEHHFFEWLAAVMLYNSTGYLSLVEKYQFEAHFRKRRVITQLADDRLTEAMSSLAAGGRDQAPDLFIYSKDGGEWFFCEVKGENDRLSESQCERFRELSRIANRPVLLVEFIAIGG